MSTNLFAQPAPFGALAESTQPNQITADPATWPTLTPTPDPALAWLIAPPLIDTAAIVNEARKLAINGYVEPSFNWRASTPDLNAPFTMQAPTEGLQPEQIELLTEWEKVQAQLKSLKLYEMELRKCVVYQAGFFNDDKKSGVERVTLAGGYQLESTKKENYNLKQDKSLIETALEPFSDTEAELLVTWKATLSVSNYKKLPDEKKAHFNGVLEITDGAPTLEIKPPKAKA